MSDMRSPEDDLFLAQAKQALEQSLDQCDARLAGRLQRARREVLESSMNRRPWGRWAGVAIASIGLLTVVFLANQRDIENHGQPMLEDIELMTSPESVELSDDLEFYDWLAESPTNG